jgi:hypothetical protein
MNVHEWLKDPKRSYKDGVELLKAKRPKDGEFFAKVNNPEADSYHFRLLMSKLQNEARKELQQVPKKEESAVKSVINVNDLKRPVTGKASTSAPTGKQNGISVRIVGNPTVDFKLLPENLQVKFNRNKSIVKELAQKQVELKGAKTDAERKQFLNSLTGLQAEQKENWKEIDDYWEENKSKLTAVDPNKELADLAIKRVRRIETLKINISREQKSLANAPEDKKAKKIEKVAAWQKELDDLDKK